jgi:hypothetical protein
LTASREIRDDHDERTTADSCESARHSLKTCRAARTGAVDLSVRRFYE